MPAAAYDVTRPDTFSDLDDIWMRELDMYSTVEESVKMVVANKIDLVGHHEAARWAPFNAHAALKMDG